MNYTTGQKAVGFVIAAFILLIPAAIMAYSAAAFCAVFQMINWNLFWWVLGVFYTLLLTLIALHLKE